jgi:glycosyltransferase involved in cell wall biosynthesis
MSISIVMPTFNSSVYINEALNSVKSKDNRIEIIIIDSVSSDNTITQVMEFSKKNKLIWISERDTGPAEALNKGFRLGTSEIIGWLNSDDLYTEGAIDRAMLAFENNPNLVMVYGGGQHVNEAGVFIADYPSLSPKSHIKNFSKGSFICQPTVFFRREVLKNVGFLDEKLKTAFDFDFWLRIFNYYPKSKIGFIEDIQACSRLHSQCLTKRLRETVTIESMDVIHRYLGSAPAHWILTFFDELCQKYPFTENKSSLVDQLKSALTQVKNFMKEDEFTDLVKKLQNDFRLRLSTQLSFLDVQPDGWVSKKLTVRVRYPAGPSKTLQLHCDVGWPANEEVAKKMIHLSILTPDGHEEKLKFGSRERFILNLQSPDSSAEGQIAWIIETRQFFVPSDLIKKSKDDRKLSFKVDKVTFV